MTIRALTVVKDEGDVIGQTLTAALRWADEILVLDNGSTDGTWQTVRRLAEREPRVRAVGCDPRPFRDGIRAQLFDAAAAHAAPGDWWCRLDADEFYVDDPRAFLAAVPRETGVVWMASLEYFFTDADAARYAADPAAFADTVPVTEKCRHYLSHWSEPRFFRHERGLRWPASDGGFPAAVWRRTAHGQRILLQHFPYRSPEQIQRRLDARLGADADAVEFGHEQLGDWVERIVAIRADGHRRAARSQAPATRPSWRDRVVPAAALDYDRHDGGFVVNEHLMPPIAAPLPRSTAVARRLARAVRRGIPEPLKTITRKALS